MNEHDLRKLTGCEPQVAEKLDRVFAAVEAATGYLMMVTDGFRTAEQQKILYAQGRTTPGRIVTHCDGVHTLSNHQSGRAADCCFIKDGRPSWDEHLPWHVYGEAAKAEGFHWGGDWPEPKTDKPHVELPKGVE